MRRFLRHLHCYVLPGLLYSLPTPAMADGPLPLISATGYRLSHYRRPPPANPEAARTLDTAARQQPLVFYCRSDCGLSWNAIKGVAALGYQNLYWYRDGIDAWEQAGLSVQAAQPQPFP